MMEGAGGIKNPVELVSRANFKFILNEDEAGAYFMSNGFQDMKAVVITIVGPGRYGKSFIMNFFLRYAIHRYSENKDPNSWLKDENKPLTGFPWEKESEKVSTRINLWPEFFVVRKENGPQTCLILLDTQTGHERNTAAAEYSSIFALCSMISSVVILNVGSCIQESNLQQLEVFAEYGKMALAETNIKPYQKLLFLVRDWRHKYQHPFGFDGGKLYLMQFMDTGKEGQREVAEPATPRENLPKAFLKIDCFLMPRLGEEATYGVTREFRGTLKSIDEDFVSNLRILVPKCIAPENLLVKTINGQEVSVKQLFIHLVKWVRLFNGPTLPVPTSMFAATVEANNEAAKENALNWFKGQVGQYASKNHVENKKLAERLQEFQDEALKKFDNYHKMGGTKYSNPHRESLQRTLQIVSENCLEENANLAHPYAKIFLYYWKMMKSVGRAVGFLVFIGVVNDILSCFDIHKWNEFGGVRIPVVEVSFVVTVGIILYKWLTFPI